MEDLTTRALYGSSAMMSYGASGNLATDAPGEAGVYTAEEIEQVLGTPYSHASVFQSEPQSIADWLAASDPSLEPLLLRADRLAG